MIELLKVTHEENLFREDEKILYVDTQHLQNRSLWRMLVK